MAAMSTEAYFPQELLEELHLNPASKEAERFGLGERGAQISDLEITGFQKKVMFMVFKDFLADSFRIWDEVNGEMSYYQKGQVEALRAIMPKLANDAEFTPDEHTSPLTLVFMGLSNMVTLESLEKIYEDAKTDAAGQDPDMGQMARMVMKQTEFCIDIKRKKEK